MAVYIGPILGMYFLAMLLQTVYSNNAINYAHLVNGTIAFFVAIELYSLFENMYEIDPNSMLSRLLFNPVLKLLKGHPTNNNPIKNLDNYEK